MLIIHRAVDTIMGREGVGLPGTDTYAPRRVDTQRAIQAWRVGGGRGPAGLQSGIMRTVNLWPSVGGLMAINWGYLVIEDKTIRCNGQMNESMDQPAIHPTLGGVCGWTNSGIAAGSLAGWWWFRDFGGRKRGIFIWTRVEKKEKLAGMQ